jgi:hypothetical protein
MNKRGSMKRFLSFIGITNFREFLTVISCIVAIFAAFKINQYINPGLNISIFYQEEKYSGRVNDMDYPSKRTVNQTLEL